MFKPGDIVRIEQSNDCATVLSNHHSVVCGSDISFQHPVETDKGTYEESCLTQAHPSVLATMADRDTSAEITRALPSFDLYMSPQYMAVMSLLASIPFTVDIRGHWKNGALLRDRDAFDEQVVSELRFVPTRHLTDAKLSALQAVLESNDTGQWVHLWRRTHHGTCPCCGENQFNLETDGRVIRITPDPCPFPEGLPLNEWELNVPSGRMVVANDLRPWFPLPEGDDATCADSDVGWRSLTQAYARIGMSHALVGNSCPGVYKLAKGRYKIASTPPKKREAHDKRVSRPYGKRVANICTDLWWYSMCDLDEFNRRCAKFGGDLNVARATVIDVKPGVYRFRHNDDARRSLGVDFTHFDWVRKPDPVKDFSADWMTLDVNAHAFVQARVAQWPTVYGFSTYEEYDPTISWADRTDEQRASCWQRVANHLFSTVGGQTRWHEKGFPLARVDAQVEDIEPPSFRMQYAWHPFSKDSGLFCEPALNSSFAKLAFRVLESIISFGTGVRNDARCRDTFFVRQRMILAVQRYRNLAMQYPGQADPEYVWWLNDGDRAEQWVERFPLGSTFTEDHVAHVARQRWIPDDAYAIEFRALKLDSGYFAGPLGGAKRENATRYALYEWVDNHQPPEHNCFWTVYARNTVIPLYVVARIVRLHEVSHMGETLVELQFDYGSPWMVDDSKRKALPEQKAKAGIRILTQREYESLLPDAAAFFDGLADES